MEEECMDVDEYLDDEDEDEDGIEVEDDVKSELLAENEGMKEVGFEAMEEKEYSDGWLYDNDLGDEWDRENESVEKHSNLDKQSGPHVKTSAITGVGLQELLELIDQKLCIQNNKGAQVVGRSIYERKWRPSQNQESGIAVEQ